MAKRRRVSRKKRQQQKRILLISMVVIALILIIFGYKLGSHQRKSSMEIDSGMVTSKLEECKSLTKASTSYSALIEYDGLDKFTDDISNFSILYTADITASVDLSKASVTVEDKTIKVTLPHATQTVSISEDNITYYDENMYKFEWSGKDDSETALSFAKQDANQAAEELDTLADCEKKAETVVNALVLPLNQKQKNNYKVSVKFK